MSKKMFFYTNGIKSEDYDKIEVMDEDGRNENKSKK